MNNNKIIPVFFSCDDNFVKYTIISIHSIISNASKDNKYVIHILNTDISKEMKDIALGMANDNFEIDRKSVV